MEHTKIGNYSTYPNYKNKIQIRGSKFQCTAVHFNVLQYLNFVQKYLILVLRGVPLFIQPKKNDTAVRFFTDFRELNKQLVRKPFVLPKISTVLHEMKGFTYPTSLDLNMGYYTSRLNLDAPRICTIICPWGQYSYKL